MINFWKKIKKENPIHAAEKFWKTLGPGLTTGAADDDPSGIATYSQMGASQGFGLLWMSLFTFPLMSAVQEMCARIGLVTGRGLAANIKKYYSKKLLYLCTGLLLFANTFNIGADLGAMAESMKLVLPTSSFAFWVVLFALVSLLFQVFVPYKAYARYLKYLTFILFSYVLSALLVGIDWSDVFRHTFIPSISFSKEVLVLIAAALGTTISPYLFFWQSSQEVEEQIAQGENFQELKPDKAGAKVIKNMRVDVFSGMFISNAVMFFIIATCAAVLYSSGITNIGTAADAAEALRPAAGELAFSLFALGILGTGFLAIPVLAGSASYAISESFGWKTGLFRKLKEASAFYGVIIAAMLLGILLNFVGLDPIKTLIYSAVFNGLISPIMIFFIIHLSGNKEVMGEFRNGKLAASLGWLTFGLTVFAGAGALFAIFS